MADSISAAIGGPGPYSARVQRATVAPAASNLGTVPGSLSSNVQLQQALQQRQVTSALLSTLVTSDGRFLRPPQAESPARAGGTLTPARTAAGPAQDWRSSAAQGPAQPWTTRQGAPTSGSDTMASIRSAEDIIQAASAGPPSAEGRRIAAEAFLMEAQAQREFEIQQEQGAATRRQWMA
jgi:hypothetical protein